jgi:hypothetical protein
MSEQTWYGVYVQGWNREGEVVEDSTDAPGRDSDDAIDAALPKMIARSAIVEIGEVHTAARVTR